MGTDARPAIAFGPSLQPGPQTRATLAASIATRVADCPGGRLVSYGTNGARQSRTWVDLWDRAAGIAAALSAHGVTPGRPVVLLVADVLDFVPAFWGCLRAGGLAVPLTGAALEVLPERRNAALRDALARLARPVILTDGFFARLAEILAPADSPPVRLAAIPDAPCPWDDRAPAGPVCLVQTSGATGHAKLAALGQETLLNRQFSAGRIAVTQPVSVLSGFPLHSITGLRAAFLGYRDWVQLPPGQLAAAPFAMLDAVQACGVSRLFLSNGQAGDILAAEAGEAPRDLRTLRQVDFGGETVVPAILRRFRDLLARHGAPQAAIRAGYGTTETGPLAAGQDPLGGEPGVEDEAARLGGCAAGVALRITGTDGALLAEGDIGEVQALCPAVLFSGYWGEPGPIGLTADGWWPTGDLGCLRGGELTLHGRAKEVLVAHGKKYALAAIDAHLQAVLRVGVRAFACAVRWPEEASERLAVVVVLAARWRDHREAITDEVAQAVARRFGLAPDPVVVAAAGQVPFTSTGKPRRAALAALLRAGALGPPPARPAAAADPLPWPPAEDPVAAAVASAWGGAIGRQAYAANLAFDQAGADSLKILTVIFRIETKLGRRLPFDIIRAGMTPRDLAAAIRQLGGFAPVAPGFDPEPAPPDAVDADLPEVAAAACARARRPGATAADRLHAATLLLVFGYAARAQAVLAADGAQPEENARLLRLCGALAAGRCRLEPREAETLDAMVADPPGVTRMVLVFPGQGGRFWGFNEPVLLARNDTGFVFLRDTGTCMYLDGIAGLGPDYPSCVAALRRIIGADGARRRLYCIGHSTGGYAALRFGLDLGAERVLAFSCPTNRDVANEPRELLERRNLVALVERAPAMAADLRELYAAAARPPEVLLCYGAAHPQDAAAARHMAGLPGLARYPLPGYAGHETLAETVRLGLFDTLVRGCLGG